MTKTKVRISPSLLAYQQEMTQLVNDLRDDKLRIAAEVEMDLEPFTDQVDITASEKAGLLMPPQIDILMPEFYYLDDGEIEGIVHVNTSDLFGIAYIHITLTDETGNLLEKGYAIMDEDCIGLWAYLPRIPPAVGATVCVRALIGDALGGMNTAQTHVTLTDEYLRTTRDLVNR
jgi:hypothetical protein